ncbi:hypothetical protein TERTU_2620 [Teredinibacter turnerae T7901]|uniref:Uncharacterized protein n=1 Tax=Teredinibacter turnerae (strain ATCC 39867 / T7901) TaxID=377629 RepID=C5BLU8_TERTT|nr:hypothetical protein TERTU_2620 [Teredinibacter turnerae T7901]
MWRDKHRIMSICYEEKSSAGSKIIVADNAKKKRPSTFK